MPSAEDRFRLNSGDVVADIFDGEAILMNLRRRIYYSLSGSGGVIWNRVVAGASLGEAADTIARQYGIARENAVQDVVALAARLVEEELLVPAGVSPVSEVPDDADGSAPEAYSPPILEKFADMKELLALDPPAPGFKGFARE
jgi:coenzyme PQQ synthesis protein D (PqqD)